MSVSYYVTILFYINNVNIFQTAGLNIKQAPHKLLCKQSHSALPANVSADPSYAPSLGPLLNRECQLYWTMGTLILWRTEAKTRPTELIFTWDQSQNVSSTLQTSKTSTQAHCATSTWNGVLTMHSEKCTSFISKCSVKNFIS